MPYTTEQIKQKAFQLESAGAPSSDIEEFVKRATQESGIAPPKAQVKSRNELDILDKVGSKVMGGTLGAVSAATNVYDKITDLPFVRLPFKAVGAAVGLAGRAVGGAVGAVGTPIKNVIQNRPLMEGLGKNIVDTARDTAKFGFDTGVTGAKVAPLAALGGIPSALIGAGQVHEGTKAIEQGRRDEGIQQGLLGIAGIASSPFIKGKFLDKSFLSSGKLLAPKDSKVVLAEAIDKSIKPSVSSVKTPAVRARYYQKANEAFHVINENKPTFEGEVVARNPKTQAETLEAIHQSKQKIFKEYDNLAEQSGRYGARYNPKPVLSELEKYSLDIGNSPEARGYALHQIQSLKELEGALPSQVQKRIADYNSSLEGFYLGRVDKAKARVDASIANKMREQLDDMVRNTTGGEYQIVKNDYGALSSIEKDLARQVANQARKQHKGFFDITDVFTGGDITSGILTMNPGLVIRGVAGKVIKNRIKFLNNPDRFIQKAFEAVERAPRAVRPPPAKFTPAGLLERGAVITPVPADTSGIIKNAPPPTQLPVQPRHPRSLERSFYP